jgi:AraC-like DNA-binding protein
MTRETPIDPETFAALRREYCRRRKQVSLCATDAEGGILLGSPSCRRQGCPGCMQARAFAITEALRWGEPTVGFCDCQRLLWAVPLMMNERVSGGLVASAAEKAIFATAPAQASFDVRRACVELRELTERENLTNASALALRRREYRDEQQRAYAIHSFKAQARTGIRELYLREEPALFSAIRANDRGRAREILNGVLVAIHYHAGNRIDLVKSFFLELVVSMCQTAVESGGDPEQLLGTNFASMSELSRINTEEQLSSWLVATLEHLMDTIQATRRRDAATQLFDAIAYMERHCCERIGRDDVARAAGLSGSHFSSLIRRESGVTFTDLLNRMRVDRAAELLSQTDRPLSLIALAAGFADQSYFTKVFKRYRKVAPLQYRRHVLSPVAVRPVGTE